jgi:hypothetical protein
MRRLHRPLPEARHKNLAALRAAMLGVVFSTMLLVSNLANATFFFDGDFVPQDWAAQQIEFGTPGSTTVMQVAIGNPGNARKVSLFLPEPGPNSVAVLHTLNTATYDPSLGAIDSIAWGLDFRNLVSPTGLIGSFGVWAVIVQGGDIFVSAPFGTGGDLGWQEHVEMASPKFRHQPLG